MSDEYLTERAHLLAAIRTFFTSRGFTEVSTPIASREVIPERYIELLQTTDGRYLQASPEMHMKQLLCQGAGPIFEITKAFRAEEDGRLHSPEFTMLEWYRPGDDRHAGMDLLDDLVQAILYTPSCARTSYRDALLQHSGVDPFDPVYPRDDSELNEIIAVKVEDKLGCPLPEILYHYPASQSALATTTKDEHGNAVAERFELYYQGIELANGYHELTDAAVLRNRLEEANDHRAADGRQRLPLPEELLRLMESPGLPPCAGVALGVDRLLMLKVGAESIAEVM